MNVHAAYQQAQAASPPRVDLILTLLETVLDRLEHARALLTRQPEEAVRLLSRCQLAMSGLAASIDPGSNETAANFQRLYEFVSFCLARRQPADLSAAGNVLQTLRAGFEAIRAEAVELERSGRLPPLDSPALARIVV